MDYSHAAYFAGAPPQPPYNQFPMSITPLTPSHSNSTGSDDYNNTSPPVSSFFEFTCLVLCTVHDAARAPSSLFSPRPGHAMRSGSGSAAHFTSGCFLLAEGVGHDRGQRAYTFLTKDAFDHYQGEQFQNFDQYAAAHFNTQPPAPPQAPFHQGPPTPPNQTQPQQLQQHNVAAGINGTAVSALEVKPPQLSDGLPVTKTEANGDRQGSNSADEEDLTPAQSRRKAQNRAA